MNLKSPMASSKSHRSIASFTGRSLFQSSSIHGYKKEHFSSDRKGPIGLTTLFIPTEAVIADLIFVHGLGGGSRSTWTYSDDASLYWPAEWLPKHTAFLDVRIHTFGYDANWDKQSVLTLHDFARSLIGAIHDCPHIPKTTEVHDSPMTRS